jgi:hypothetical protein
MKNNIDHKIPELIFLTAYSEIYQTLGLAMNGYGVMNRIIREGQIM